MGVFRLCTQAHQLVEEVEEAVGKVMDAVEEEMLAQLFHADMLITMTTAVAVL